MAVEKILIALSEKDINVIIKEGGHIGEYDLGVEFETSLPEGWGIKILLLDSEDEKQTVILQGLTKGKQKQLARGKAAVLSKKFNLPLALAIEALKEPFAFEVAGIANRLKTNKWFWVNMDNVANLHSVTQCIACPDLTALELSRRKAVARIIQRWWNSGVMIPPKRPKSLHSAAGVKLPMIL